MLTEDFDITPIKEYAINGWTLDDVHGLSHWKRVERNGLMLLTPEVNPKVVRLFAYLHDKCRINNYWDEEHGKRSAKMLYKIKDTLLKDLTDDEFKMLYNACYFHTIKQKTGNPTVDACFDADRLDLVRVGIMPAPNRMATQKGKEFAANIEEFNRKAAEFEI